MIEGKRMPLDLTNKESEEEHDPPKRWVDLAQSDIVHLAKGNGDGSKGLIVKG